MARKQLSRNFANTFHVCVGDQLLCEISRGMSMRVDRDEMEESSASSFERVGRPERLLVFILWVSYDRKLIIRCIVVTNGDSQRGIRMHSKGNLRCA